MDYKQSIRNLRARKRKDGNNDPIHAIIAGDSTGNYLDPVLRPGKVYVSGNRVTGWINGPRTGLVIYPGLHVLVEYDEWGRYYISRVDGEAELNSGSDPNATSMPPRQSMTQDQLETLRVTATGDDLTVSVKSWVAIVDRTAYQFLGSSIDLASYVPAAGQMRYVVIFVASDFSTLEAHASTARSLGDIALNIDDIQECINASSLDSTPIWAIPLADGQTVVDLTDIALGVDLRNLVNNTITGGTSGDVSGPGSSTDRAIATWNGTDGRTLRDNPFATVDSSGNVNAISYRISGVGGNGFAQFVSQSSNPTAPADGFRLYSDTNDRLSWIKQGDSFGFTLAGTPTAQRTQTLQDASGTIALTSDITAATALAVILAPASSSRNVIQPTGDFKALVVKGNASQSTTLQEWQNSSGSVLASIGATGNVVLLGSSTVASGASATWNGISFNAATATITGSTNIATAAGFNYINIARPTLTSSNALTVTNSATLYIANSPAVSGSASLTNPYALWVDDGQTRLDGPVAIRTSGMSNANGLEVPWVSGDTNLSAIFGGSSTSGNNKFGVYGLSDSNDGVRGTSNSGTGVRGGSTSGAGVTGTGTIGGQFTGTGGTGVIAVSDTSIVLNATMTTGSASGLDDVVLIKKRTSGTPAAGYGSSWLWRLNSDSTADQLAGRITMKWVTATDASRSSSLIFTTYNVASELTPLELSPSTTIAAKINAPASGIGLIVRANATTPDDIQEWQSSGGTILSSVKPWGGISVSYATSTVDEHGLSFIVTSSNSSIIGQLYGVTGQLVYSGSGTISNAYAGYFRGLLSGSSPATANISAIVADVTSNRPASTLTAIRVNSWGNVSTGSVGAIHGLRIASPINSGSGGTITTATGIEVFDVSVATTNYALRTNMGTVSLLGSNTIASASGATWKGIELRAATLTLTGSTNVTTSTGVNYLDIARPTITSSNALTVTNAATVYIANSPLAAGSATITNAYSLWVDAGVSRFDGNIDLSNAACNIILDTSTGTKIGTATNQKLSLWGQTPTIQPSSSGETAGFTAGAGSAVDSAATFTGNVGTTAYTLNDIVKHLKNIGAIAL